MARNRYSRTPLMVRTDDLFHVARASIDTTNRTDDQFYDVVAGDQLSTIAFALFGDAALWWVIAEYNDIVDPFATLVAGTRLRAPGTVRVRNELG